MLEQRCCRPYGPANEFTFAVWADVVQPRLRAGAAESAFKGADSRLRRFVRKVCVAALAVWTELEHAGYLPWGKSGRQSLAASVLISLYV